MFLPKEKDLTGKKLGKLKVVEFKENRVGRGGHYWTCVCECGKSISIRATLLRSGKQKDCGCEFIKSLSRRMKDHGKGRTPQAAVWRSMIARCHNKKNRSYRLYGAKGITVCDRWRNSYLAFLSDMGERPPETEIDRIDGGKGYYPGNCRWVTCKENQRNKTSSRIIVSRGVAKTMSEWSEATGIKIGTLWKRLKLGWSHEDAVGKAVKKNHTSTVCSTQ